MKVQNEQPVVVTQLEQQAEGEPSFVACRSWPRRSVLGNVVQDPAAAAGRYRAMPRRRDRERIMPHVSGVLAKSKHSGRGGGRGGLERVLGKMGWSESEAR